MRSSKIENDGFGLGAQRRAIEKNDLPQARTEITEYLHRLAVPSQRDGSNRVLRLLNQGF